MTKENDMKAAMAIVVCPACEGSGMMKDVDEWSIHHHVCRCCTGLGEFPEAEMMDRVKDMKTWPDSIRREHGFKVE